MDRPDEAKKVDENGEPVSQRNLHGQILVEAKKNQARCLKRSESLSKQLYGSMTSLVKSNSTNKDGTCLDVLDKITTIHQLDGEIERQLREDIARNFDCFYEASEKLDRLMRKIHRRLSGLEGAKFAKVDQLQTRVECIDQELRILELTLRNVQHGETEYTIN